MSALLTWGIAVIVILAVLAAAGWLMMQLFGVDVEDDAPEVDDESGPAVDGDSILQTLFETLGSALGIVTLSISKSVDYTVYGFTRVVPWSQLLWRKLFRLSLWRYQRSSGADAISLTTMPNGKIRPEPVKWLERQFDGDTQDQTGWKVKGEDRYYNATGGSETRRLGASDVVWNDITSRQQISSVEARFSKALDLPIDAPGPGKVQVYRDALIETTVPQSAMGSDLQTDGGQTLTSQLTGQPVVDRQQITATHPGEWETSVVDVAAGQGYDGLTLDPELVKEVYHHDAGADELRDAMARGRLAALLEEEDQTTIALAALIIGGLFGLAIGYGEEIIAAVFGSGGGSAASSGGGGGGGSVLPIMLDVVEPAVAVVPQLVDVAMVVG
jgi:hypothetical protein